METGRGRPQAVRMRPIDERRAVSGGATKPRVSYMPNANRTRRRFLADVTRTATSGWLVCHLPWLATLAGCARDDARSGATFTSLTASEARAWRAFAAQIIPPDDDTPGADTMGAVQFLDHALGQPFFATSVPVIYAGLADLDVRARLVEPSGEFASLGAAQQIAIMRQIEHDPFFTVARTLVVIGTLADPSYGGNTGGAGWAMLGMEHRPSYTAPFGWYDAQAASDAGLQAA